MEENYFCGQYISNNFSNEDGLKEDMILGVQVAVEHYISDDLEFCVGIPITSKTTVRLEDGDGR